ncbi:MAG: sporulation protein [Gammaproteobacteria bacterium]|nr:MAG: sporulation protein [Pseudomonadota bacterium]PIE38722.1 MAG: sporulation protein [Gammaproteobacteria bacterium]
MPRDLTKPGTTKRQPDRPERKDATRRLFIVVALVASAFTCGLYYLSSIPDTGSARPDRQSSVTRPGVKTPATKTTPPTRTAPREPDDYEFYTLLRETEIENTPVDAYTPKTKVKYDYLLQTGSFRNKTDAERQKANIAFLGMRAVVKRTTTDSGIWYRVQVGPFTSRSKMNSAVDKMVSVSIQPLVRKIPKGK